MIRIDPQSYCFHDWGHFKCDEAKGSNLSKFWAELTKKQRS